MTGLDIAKKLMEYGVPYEHAKILAAVAYPESGYNPKAEAISPYEHSIGLFQINMKAHWPKLIRWTGSRDAEDWKKWLMIPENNIKAAAEVYKSQGLNAWTVYRKGTYIPYLDKLENLVVKDSQLINEKTGSVNNIQKSAIITGSAVILSIVIAFAVALVVAGAVKNA